MVPGYELPEALKQILPMVFWKLHFVFAVAAVVVLVVAVVAFVVVRSGNLLSGSCCQIFDSIQHSREWIETDELTGSCLRLTFT